MVVFFRSGDYTDGAIDALPAILSRLFNTKVLILNQDKGSIDFRFSTEEEGVPLAARGILIYSSEHYDAAIRNVNAYLLERQFRQPSYGKNYLSFHGRKMMPERKTCNHRVVRLQRLAVYSACFSSDWSRYVCQIHEPQFVKLQSDVMTEVLGMPNFSIVCL